MPRNNTSLKRHGELLPHSSRVQKFDDDGDVSMWSLTLQRNVRLPFVAPCCALRRMVIEPGFK